MFHLERDPTLYEEIEKGTESVQNVDYTKVYYFKFYIHTISWG